MRFTPEHMVQVLAQPDAAQQGFDPSIFINPARLHLTLLMLKLYSDEARHKAAQALQGMQAQVGRGSRRRTAAAAVAFPAVAAAALLGVGLQRRLWRRWRLCRLWGLWRQRQLGTSICNAARTASSGRI